VYTFVHVRTPSPVTLHRGNIKLTLAKDLKSSPPFSGAGARISALLKPKDNGYVLQKHFDEAYAMFCSMPDLAGATILISHAAKQQHFQVALAIYSHLISVEHPNIAIYRTMLYACKTLGEVKQGVQLWDHMKHFSITPDAVCFGILAELFALAHDGNAAAELLSMYHAQKLNSLMSIPICIHLCKALCYEHSTRLEDVRLMWRVMCETPSLLTAPTLNSFEDV
jgi:pentatricopeptide repeat protein